MTQLNQLLASIAIFIIGIGSFLNTLNTKDIKQKNVELNQYVGKLEQRIVILETEK